MDTDPRTEHKNRSRAPLRPLDAPTLGLSVLGLGFLRPAPGTWGSLPPCALAALLVLLDVEPSVSLGALAVVFVLSCAACVVWGRYAETRFGRKDAAEVVADETAGVCLPVAPALLSDGTVIAIFAQIAWAFVLFRVFDIIKPSPARELEKLPHGWGVLIDDLVAGLYALIAFVLSMMAMGALSPG